MPLPEDGSAWPPAPWDVAQAQYAINDAWYRGDTGKLAKLYGGTGASVRPSEATHMHGGTGASVRPSEATHMHGGAPHAGGMVGAISRMFWGRPVPPGQNRTRLHIPAPSDLAVLSSDLLFSEPPRIKLGKADAASQDRTDTLMNAPTSHIALNTLGELSAALGASALVVRWDDSLSDQPWLQSVGADVVLPEFRYGFTTAVTLWSEYSEGRKVWRHMERHEPGNIIHALYRGTPEKLGHQVNLADRPETEHLVKLEGAVRDGLTVAIPTGTNVLTAAYNLNQPSREWRRMGQLMHAGRSDFQGILPLFDVLDETWSSWIRDLRLARARLMVPDQMLSVQGPGIASTFDVDQELFSYVQGQSRPDATDYAQLVQPDIRVEAHRDTVYEIYKEILRAAGYSPTSWGESRGSRGSSGQMTAAEVQDRDKSSERTRDKKSLYAKQTLAQITQAMLAVDAEVFRSKGGKALTEAPQVEFSPSSQFDALKNSQTMQNLRAAGLLTIETGVRESHPDWDDETVLKETKELMKEQDRKYGITPDPTRNAADQ